MSAENKKKALLIIVCDTSETVIKNVCGLKFFSAFALPPVLLCHFGNIFSYSLYFSKYQLLWLQNFLPQTSWLLFSFKIFLKTHVKNKENLLSGISVAFSSVSFIYVLSFRVWSSYRSWLIDLLHRFCNALPPVSLPLHSNSPCILIRSDSSLAVCLHRFPALQLLALRPLFLLWSEIFLSTNLSKLP